MNYKLPTTFTDALLLIVKQQLMIEQQQSDITQLQEDLDYANDVIEGVNVVERIRF